ncbi:MAG: RecX family transcriptional regulator [Streptococcaceae bacterium]|jgi:regulatory protein|nr:RecX family transcriptional regulator [Streptococcaceae bacterium]
MRKINEITKLKKNYRITFDNEEVLSVSENTLTEFLLVRDKCVSDELFDEIISYQGLDYGRKVALTALNYRAYSVYEMKQKLISKAVCEEAIPEIITFLKSTALLDDVEYAQNIFESMLASKKKGREAISYKMWQKGIKQEIIDEILVQLSADDEYDIALSYADKLITKYAHESKRAVEQKITASLMRAGFSFDLANQAVNELEITSDEAEEYEKLVQKALPVYRRISRQYDGWELRQRIFRNLAGKGFDFDLINRFIAERQESEDE